jgi:UDP-2,3-diacylglucosamine pyrophosphatase LpxH
MGIDDDFTECMVNRPRLVKFLQSLQNTKDVRELVIAGDFLDEWFLPIYYYPLYTDQDQFYRGVIANNQSVIDQLNKVIASGIKVVYVPGNHDLTLKASVLQAAIPGLVQASGSNSGISGDPQGLGAYYTGDRNEIVIEHGHRYDAFSAPDTLSNEALCGNQGTTILPPGYFYSRYAATWVLEGKPTVAQNLPTISDSDYANLTNPAYGDQLGAYTYYKILTSISNRMTPYESGDAHFATDKIFKMRISGFNGDYTYKDFFPQLLTDEATGNKFISAPTLFRNVQLSWQARQVANKVKVPETTFATSVAGAVAPAFPESFFSWAKANYLENPNEANVEVVVFGHTHVPSHRLTTDGKRYVNAGTWIDHNTDLPAVGSRTFVVVTTGAAAGKDATAVYQFGETGGVADITATVS